MSELAKAMAQVRNARWEGWQRMAAKLPDHHILAVELFRTEERDTLAVFTVVKSGKPVQQIVRADPRGTSPKAVIPNPRDCAPIRVGPSHHVEASLPSALDTMDDGGEAHSISLGEPPPKQPPDPGIIALGSVLLQSAFDAGEKL